MTNAINLPTATLLTTAQAASYLALSPKSLERFRLDGSGPVYLKVGPGKRARVRYRLADLDAWLATQQFTATAQYNRREVL